MPETVEALAAHGLRATPQRIAVYEALVPRTDHPSVETLYEAIHTKYPTISLNTVYSTLVLLEKVGLIRRIDAGDGLFRYDGNPKEHVHVVCVKCQTVADVPHQHTPDLSALIRDTVETSGYTITDTALYLYGCCPQCAAAARQDSGPSNEGE